MPTAALQEVVVTASRVQQPIADVVADVSIINRTEIDRLGIGSVPELLARLPGLQTVTMGDSSRVYIRGADSRMTALYVDGVRVDSQDGLRLGGGVPWELIPMSQIDRIEVLRGPASAVYGSDAMGGVVQVFTRRGEPGWSPYVDMGLGSFNSKNFNAGFSGAHSGWDYSIGLGLQDSDGFDTRPDLIHTPGHEASARKAANLRLGYQLTTDHRLELTALDSQLQSHYVPWGGGIDVGVNASLTTSALKWQAKWSEAYSSRVSFLHSEIAKNDSEPHDFQTQLHGILIENNIKLAGGLLTAVLEQKNDGFDSKPTLWDPAFKGDRAQHALALGYGARHGQHTYQVNVRNDSDSLFGSHQTGAMAYAYSLTSDWRANLSAGTAFRAPTLEQVFGPYGSTQLAPETNRSVEVGFSYDHAQRNFKAVWFHNALHNMISSSATLSTCSAGFFCYYNVGQASIQGVTLNGSQRFGSLALRASLDVLDPVDDMTGKILSLRARKSMTLSAEQRAGAWNFGAELQGVGERFDNAANTIALPGYVLTNLNASTELSKDWRLSMRIDNATNTQYQQVGQYATPGRTFYVSVAWQPN